MSTYGWSLLFWSTLKHCNLNGIFRALAFEVIIIGLIPTIFTCLLYLLSLSLFLFLLSIHFFLFSVVFEFNILYEFSFSALLVYQFHFCFYFFSGFHKICNVYLKPIKVHFQRTVHHFMSGAILYPQHNIIDYSLLFLILLFSFQLHIWIFICT